MKVIDAIPLFLRRVFTIGILLAILGFVGLGVLSRCDKSTTAIPGMADAPWAIQTSTRTFYATEYKQVAGVPWIRGYWWFDGRKYEYDKGEKNFPPAIWGKVIVIVRTVK